MERETNSNSAADSVEFWDSRYRAGRTPWDFRGVPEALTCWLAAGERAGRVLIPGCGFGYEVQAFHEAGWDVTAIDYSPTAVDRARSALGAVGDKVLLGDFFAHDFAAASFDVIYERTFPCALPPERWQSYGERMVELLTNGGKLLGSFFYGVEKDPPPYPLTEADAQAVLAARFVRTADEPVTDSLPLFAGRERWQVWEKRR